MIQQSKSQTLITGYLRTGSEYLSLLLNCHPQISVTMYSVNVLRFIYKKYDPISEKQNFEAALNDTSERIEKRYNRSLNKAEILEAFSSHSNKTYGVFYDLIMNSLYLSKPAEHWAEKNQVLWREIPTFLDMMPEGKAILIIRDPRSVLFSFKNYTYVPPPAYLGAVFNMLDAMRYGLLFKEKYPDRVYVVRYEDIARNPQTTTKKLWRFLGLDESLDSFDYSNWIDAYAKPWHANSSFHSNDDLRKFDVESSINRWKDNLSNLEIRMVEMICKEVMQSYGYTTTTEKADWLPIIRLFAADDKITSFFRKWVLTGEGVEAFPNDPLDPKNWRNENEKPYEKPGEDKNV